MASLGHNIRRYRKIKKLTLEQLAIESGSDTGNLSRLERDLQGYSQELLERIASALGVGVAELFTGGARDGLDEVASKGLVPLISWVQAGSWAEVMDPHAVGDAEEWLPCPVPHGSRTFILKVRGVSMENPGGRPSFSEGDLVFVDPDRPASNRSIVVVRTEANKEATLKQMIVEGDRVMLKPLNPAWPEPWIVVNGDATIVGVVIFKGERM